MIFNFSKFTKQFLLFLFIIFSKPLYSQEKINGVVLDNNNVPIVGASVIIENTKIGTTTDIDGSFFLLNVPQNSKLLIKNKGFKNYEIFISDTKSFEIHLNLDDKKKKRRYCIF